MTDFLFNPQLVLLVVGRGILSMVFVLAAALPIYLFSVGVYPTLKPQAMESSKYSTLTITKVEYNPIFMKQYESSESFNMIFPNSAYIQVELNWAEASTYSSII